MKYTPIDQCIYCGSKEGKLGDEHIIPYALNGALILPSASCKKCEKETHTYEYTVCRTMFGNFRMRYKVRTRRKKKRPTHIQIGTINSNSSKGKALVKVEEHPALLMLYKFEESDYLKRNSEKDSFFKWLPIIISSNEELDKFAEKYNWDRRFVAKTVPDKFARMLAKIAFSLCAAEIGVDGFTPFPQLIDVILNRSDNISYLIGGDWDIPPSDPKGYHYLGLSYKINDGFADIIVEIRLFPAFETPLYRVVVGQIDLNDRVQRELMDRNIQKGIKDGSVTIINP